ncbi:hypothetical protein L2E82_25537 [Cichorium intybus]|uniref:Uncharacterized protein n=1 Tax=Cichorium intybus TaxID=13427 RepID=A0ACB9E4I4_CICIN|nr:hypothetical protein L2E82_25537 [Cichorium intybus]
MTQYWKLDQSHGNNVIDETKRVTCSNSWIIKVGVDYIRPQFNPRICALIPNFLSELHFVPSSPVAFPAVGQFQSLKFIAEKFSYTSEVHLTGS